MHPLHIRLSRRVNALRGGDPAVMLCAALYRERSPWCLPLDVAFLLARLCIGRWDWRHCQNVAAWEDAPGWGVCDGLERVRREGW